MLNAKTQTWNSLHFINLKAVLSGKVTQVRKANWKARIYEANVAVYHVFFIKVIIDRIIYTPTLILSICEVSFHLMKRYFYYFILKTTCFVLTVRA